MGESTISRKYDLGQCRVLLNESRPVFDRYGKTIPHTRQHLNTLSKPRIEQRCE